MMKKAVQMNNGEILIYKDLIEEVRICVHGAKHDIVMTFAKTDNNLLEAKYESLDNTKVCEYCGLHECECIDTDNKTYSTFTIDQVIDEVVFSYFDSGNDESPNYDIYINNTILE